MVTVSLVTAFENQGQSYDPGVKSKRRRCVLSISLGTLRGFEKRYCHYVEPRGMKAMNAATSHIRYPKLQVNTKFPVIGNEWRTCS